MQTRRAARLLLSGRPVRGNVIRERRIGGLAPDIQFVGRSYAPFGGRPFRPARTLNLVGASH